MDLISSKLWVTKPNDDYVVDNAKAVRSDWKKYPTIDTLPYLYSNKKYIAFGLVSPDLAVIFTD